MDVHDLPLRDDGVLLASNFGSLVSYIQIVTENIAER